MAALGDPVNVVPPPVSDAANRPDMPLTDEESKRLKWLLKRLRRGGATLKLREGNERALLDAAETINAAWAPPL